MENIMPDYTSLLTGYGSDQAHGFVNTAIPGIKFFWSRAPVPRGPRVYDPGIVLIGQGYKLGYQAGRQFRYDADNYLILSLPSAYESESFASAEAPLVGVFVSVDLLVLQDLVSIIDRDGGAHRWNLPASMERGVSAFEPAQPDDAFRDMEHRLIAALVSPLESQIMGAALVREVMYRVLMGPQGQALAVLTQQTSVNARVSKALALIHQGYMQDLSVEALADRAGMSVSAFHRGFKFVTGDTPLQYVKKIRLDKARDLMVTQGTPAAVAAHSVGYESPSQFSREFKRYYQHPPSFFQRHAAEVSLTTESV